MLCVELSKDRNPSREDLKKKALPFLTHKHQSTFAVTEAEPTPEKRVDNPLALYFCQLLVHEAHKQDWAISLYDSLKQRNAFYAVGHI